MASLKLLLVHASGSKTTKYLSHGRTFRGFPTIICVTTRIKRLRGFAFDHYIAHSLDRVRSRGRPGPEWGISDTSEAKDIIFTPFFFLVLTPGEEAINDSADNGPYLESDFKIDFLGVPGLSGDDDELIG